MQKFRNIFIALFFISFTAKAQQAEAVQKYIAAYKDLAIAEMQRTGVPAAITLAQGIHESGAGQSELALKSNNHFGIKCKTNWAGEKVYHDDDARGECFRKYTEVDQSYVDHSDFLKNGQRYAFLFELDPADYTGWANGLKKAGYATNPKYPQVLIKLVEDYQLQEYTLMALGKAPPPLNQTTAMTGLERDATESVAVPPAEVPEKELERQRNEVVNTKANYPEGQFIINETKVVFVQKGTSFLSIAKQYDVDLSKIFDFNEMPRNEVTEKDMLVYLQRKRKTGNDEFHIVQPGESLYDIAQLQAIRLESLRELNWLGKNETPAPGVKLDLKTKSVSMPKLAVKNNYSVSGN
jgi:LysM repeat protein